MGWVVFIRSYLDGLCPDLNPPKLSLTLYEDEFVYYQPFLSNKPGHFRVFTLLNCTFIVQDYL